MKTTYPLIKKFTLIFILLINVSLIGCNTSSKSEPFTASNLKLGTLVTITLFDSDNQQIMDAIFSRLDEIESKMSINILESEINHLNNEAGKSPVIVSPDTYEVIENGITYSKNSKGYFDISIGPLVSLWGIGTDHAHIPRDSEIENVLPLIDYSKIILDPSTFSVYLSQPDMKIDLGGIAKGYAADEIVRILDQYNIDRAIINLGGNIFVKGNKSKDENWKIGIQNPYDSRGAYIGVVSISNKTVVTSGIYERFFEQDGIKYHHILSPFTGFPVDNSLASVSIITSNSMIADAYSTGLFALGLEEGLKLANENSEIFAIFVTKDNKVFLSKGTESFFKLTDDTFHLQ